MYSSPTWTAAPQTPAAFQIIRFELTANLSVGGSANCVPLHYAPSDTSALSTVKTTDYQKLTGVTLKAFDVRHRNYAPTGTRGFGIFMPDSQRLEILDLWHNARWCEFTLTEPLTAGGEAEATVTNSWDGWPLAESTITVTDDSVVGFEADDGAHGIAVQRDDGTWIVLNITCPAES